MELLALNEEISVYLPELILDLIGAQYMVGHLIFYYKSAFLNLCIQRQEVLELVKEREVVYHQAENRKNNI